MVQPARGPGGLMTVDLLQPVFLSRCYLKVIPPVPWHLIRSVAAAVLLVGASCLTNNPTSLPDVS